LVTVRQINGDGSITIPLEIGNRGTSTQSDIDDQNVLIDLLG